MTDAVRIQEQMALFLRRRRDLTHDDEARRFADAHIAGNPRLTPVAQLEIYREQFWLRHIDSLLEDFPGVSGILGQERWDRLVWEYLATIAPTSYDLGELGEKLPGFAATRDWLEERELVVDMATLEYGHALVFSAPDAGKLEPAKLAAVPEDAWETAQLVPDPGLRLQRLRYPVLELRRRLIAAREQPEAAPIPWPEPLASCIAVHRRERAIHHDVLEPNAFALLEAILRGEPLGRACESAAATAGVSLEELSQGLEQWFAAWANRGYVVDVRIAPR